MDSNTNSDDRNTCVRRICSSAQSSDDDYDLSDVVVRNPRHSSILLADEGDGSEADLLGTTPPRSRIRNKERRRTNIETEQFLQKVRVAKRNSDSVIKTEPNGTTGDRFRKRASLKLVRARERDFKQDMSQREQRAEQLPSPGGGVTPAVPTLVESCSRFMSLTSKLKCREDSEACEDLEPVETRRPDQLPPNRVSFHNTFSMLINMGNIDKGCRRTISREEQVWQNELKDLIWLELQAKIAGRTLAQQDAYLCAQRNIVPTVVQNIIDYRFVNTNPCVAQGALGALAGSRDHLDARDDSGQENGIDDEVVVGCLSLNCVRCTAAVGKAMRELTTLLDSYYNAVALYPSCKAMTVDHPLVATQLFKNRIKLGCLSLNCVRCTAAVGKAMRELTTLLDSYYNAVALYPSCKAMTVDHPLVATQLFKNRIKAMCLWYNTALHLRLKMLAVRRMMRTLRRRRPRSSLDSGLSRQSSESTRPSQVRFNMSGSPSASSGSEGAHSDGREGTKDSGRGQSDASDERDERDDEGKGQDEVDFRAVGGDGSDAGDQLTPEIVISSSSSRYGSASSEGGACTEASIGGASEGGANGEGCSVGGADSVGCGSVEGCNVGGVHSVGGGSMGGGSVGGSAGEAEAWRADVYELGPLDDITRLRLLGKCDVSPYREFHVEVLKTQGVRRCMMFVNKMRKNVLHKVHHTLEKPDRDARENFQEEEAAEVFDDTKDEEDKTEPCADDDLTNTYELTRFGCWSEESLAMRLPSYRAHLLALSSICMEAVHDYLELRLETRPDNPSCLTIKQLINELKEGLDISTEMRRDFARSVEVALRDAPAPPAARLELLRLLRAYDATVQAVLKQYLSYLTTMSETEIMGRSCLQQEWAFTARLARRVSCAALLAPITFSDIACNQITVLLNEFKNKFDALVEHKKLDPPDRYSAYSMCRSVQDIYARWREPLLASAQWARALAAKLARARPPAFAPQREAVLNKLMSMRDFIVMHTDMVLERTSVPDEELELTEGLVTRVRVLLLQMFKLGFELHKELFKLCSGTRGEGGARPRPASLQPRPARPLPRAPRPRRPETIYVATEPAIHKEIHRVVNDAGRWGGSARRSVVSSPPRALRHKFARSESIGEDAVFDDKLFETLNNYGENLAMSRIERLLSGCEEPEAAPPRAREGAAGGAAADHEWAARVARAVIEFARCWMRFVVERCDRGRGLRPRWASQGLEFLMLACDPCNTKHLSEEEFEELKQLMDGCISHVVGSRPAPRAEPAAPHAPRSRPRLHSPSPGSPQASPGARDVPPPPTPPNEPEPLLSFHAMEMQPHKKRVLKAIAQLEEERDAKLRALKAVGRVAACAVTSYEPKLRQLTFKWQRGLKIGAGTFGKVYTVVNTESGQLLAMKELGIAAGDRRALQRAANELRVLEGVIHPHLVRYYGCELHKEEMLLFMELCVEGSLEALVATSGALGERTTRRYTKQLLSAVAELHNRNIVHRDIKSGNIFLTNEGHCLKLGDFGCAVKIRANTTAPGELQGFVGTQAYMAPEVFMKSSGHGRAADIWSLGCVVTEMASGKRPFSEYDSNYQIMFVVGMGGRPAEPPLSGEGRAFCRSCLTHDPDARPKADQLSLHSFLMVKSDDNECDCEAAYLRT